jgi:hypothetical protein
MRPIRSGPQPARRPRRPSPPERPYLIRAAVERPAEPQRPQQPRETQIDLGLDEVATRGVDRVIGIPAGRGLTSQARVINRGRLRAPRRPGRLRPPRGATIGFENVLDDLLGPTLELIQLGRSLVQLSRVGAPIVAPLPSEATVSSMGIRENATLLKNLPRVFLHGSRQS